VAGREAAS
jgi:hypothetical protein